MFTVRHRCWRIGCPYRCAAVPADMWQQLGGQCCLLVGKPGPAEPGSRVRMCKSAHRGLGNWDTGDMHGGANVTNTTVLAVSMLHSSATSSAPARERGGRRRCPTTLASGPPSRPPRLTPARRPAAPGENKGSSVRAMQKGGKLYAPGDDRQDACASKRTHERRQAYGLYSFK